MIASVFSADDHRYMARALELAEKGRYSTHPNPRVGCVLVRDGQVIGEGWHRRAGEPHAERNALAMAGDARGATAYVTLEPCSHTGRTGPCADALVEAGVRRVVSAMQDPNPKVSGCGHERLRAAGVDVDYGLMSSQAQALNPGFISRMTRRRPWVRVKLAASLDGRTAMASGESHWISCDASRRDVHHLRACSDAIITGIGTVLADDPSLNVRLTHEQLPGLADDLPVPTPLRVVLDSSSRFPDHASMLSLPGETWVFSPDERSIKGADCRQAVMSSNGIDLDDVLGKLAEREINEVLVEAGPTLAGAFLRQGLADELVIYLAPHLMGDAARGLFHLPGLETMADRLSLDFHDVRRIGSDLRITVALKPAEE